MPAPTPLPTCPAAPFHQLEKQCSLLPLCAGAQSPQHRAQEHQAGWGPTTGSGWPLPLRLWGLGGLGERVVLLPPEGWDSLTTRKSLPFQLPMSMRFKLSAWLYISAMGSMGD